MSKDTIKITENKKAVLKKARKKYFSYGLAVNLANLPSRPKLFHSYLNTLACAKTLVVDAGGRAHSKYCKNRWCLICSRIRVAILMNQYEPRLRQCKDLWMVTLSRPNVSEERLKGEIKEYQRLWGKIAKTRWFMAALKVGMIGIRKFECTINPDNGTYHPHLHVLIDGKDNARRLYADWLRINPTSSERAQDCRKCYGEGSYKEIFKYMTKVLAKSKKDGKTYVDIPRLGVIFEACSGQRFFFRIGTKEAWQCDEVSEDFQDDDLEATIEGNGYNEGESFAFVEADDFYGYYSVETGEQLTEFKPSGNLCEVIRKAEGRYSN